MKYHYVIIRVHILMLLSCAAYAQEYGWDFKWPRTKAMEIGAGFSSNGLMLYGGYNYFFSPKKHRYISFSNLITSNPYTAFPCKRKTPIRIPPGLSAKLSGFYERGQGKEIQYRSIGIDGSLLYVFYYNRMLYAYLKGGVTFSNDALITPIKEGNTFNDYNTFHLGLLGGGEIERLLGHDRTSSIIVGYDQRYLFNPDPAWGKKRWFIYIGYRFKISKK